MHVCVRCVVHSKQLIIYKLLSDNTLTSYVCVCVLCLCLIHDFRLLIFHFSASIGIGLKKPHYRISSQMLNPIELTFLNNFFYMSEKTIRRCYVNCKTFCAKCGRLNWTTSSVHQKKFFLFSIFFIWINFGIELFVTMLFVFAWKFITYKFKITYFLF